MDYRAKRKVFKEAFKDKLLENGFIFKNGMFVRVHPSEVLLYVSLQLTYYARSFICFDVIPLCCEFNTDLIKVESRRMDGFCHLYVKEENNPKLDEPFGIPNFGLQYLEFWNVIFDDLNAVHTIEDAYAFTRNLPYKTNVYKECQKYIDVHMKEMVYAGISLKKWDMAQYFLDKMIQVNNEIISIATDKLAELQDIPKKRARQIDVIDMEKNSIADCRQRNSHWNSIKALIENMNYDALNHLLADNCSEWDSYCKSRWPKFYNA